MSFDRVIDRRGSGCFRYDALKMLYGRDDLLSLWVADMDFEVAPAIKEAMRERLEHGVFGYNLRLPDFYEAVANWVETRYGFSCRKEWMVCTPGIMPAINLAVLHLTEPGDVILIQTPVYKPFFDAILGHKRVLISNPLINDDGYFRIDLEDFERKASQAKMFFLCSPHNPVGRVWSADELIAMGEICRRYGVIVVSDEIHGDLVYEGRRAVSIASLEDFSDFTICCVSPAKSFNLAGLTTAVIIIKNQKIRQPLADMVDKLHLYLGNAFGISGLIAAYRESDGWLQDLLSYLQDNRDYLCQAFAAKLPELKITKPEGTYLAWIDFRALGLNDAQLSDMLVNRAGLALDPGTKYGVEGSGFSRLNFAVPRIVLHQAVERLQSSIKDLG